MPNAFITGAAGFIGENTAREFIEHGWHVFALVHRKASPFLAEMADSGRVTLIRGDLKNFDEIERNLTQATNERQAKLDVIAHCAGRASDVGRRSEFRQVNFESVKNLCEMTSRMDVGRFVFISTTDVYGMRDFNGESENELPLINNARNPYPEYKIAAEEWIKKTLPPERFSIIRPAAVWGVGDPTLTPRIVSFLKSSPYIIHFGKWLGQNRWPLAHVSNVAAGIYLAGAMSEAAGQAINVLDSEITTIDDFYRMIASIYLPEKKLRSVTLPMWLGKMLGAAISTISNVLNLDHPVADPSLYALYSVSRNLDFGNGQMVRLFERAGHRAITREEGLEQLRYQRF
ncbi:MAG: NAD(P)-dependent oxidoreductase [Armatimonadetes bacterium]|nr:NAD(P)-dependent oxidoreductase [Armatimonadota bacterium]